MSINNPYQQYKKNQIETADQGKLIVMLYDGAIKFISRAIELMDRKKVTGEDIETIHKNIIRTQDIITELMSSLNMDAGDISQRLFSIYMYMNNKLIEGNIQKDSKPLTEVKNHLIELREAWFQAAKTVAQDPKQAVGSGAGGINIAT
ncbi:MAG: flagellar export chaperone FliS [Spirochaetes bacterium GWF1_31_7]|nr:MAG: flagellar export chaperone FliS [Spirochaetes bacterium GWE1_32_154]OHD48342.1 MAG: flagellar export chaperone FliS [Spirochaetes bacterium GWF1_31_7]OHD51623.1 MAG: flagellar export chaperone FliS [Spirochaetes bacterium GWE2_31_10]OHD81917.1 MAG: flagellar export chaperone FliS [Spirochaetes bacterium RIFOXYB1_FULL_32_8]HBD96344.1 flagellar export chaperone FliS [Spirochaetia bacterium]